jgi:putative salt-induced outer membrane protein YdiY
MKKMFSLLAAACLATGAMADKITTVTDDVINGTVTEIKGGNVVIDTAFAGTLTIAREKIKAIEYENEGTLFARTDATVREKVEVSVSRDAEGNVVLIPVAEKAEALALSEVSTLWATDGVDPDFPPVKLWSFSASLGMTGHEGSSSDISVSAYIDAVRSTENTTLKLYGTLNKARSDGVKTSEQYIAGLDYENRPTERWSWYVRDEIQHNRFNDYKLRNVAGSGAGYYFWNTTTDGRKSLLRLRLGLAHSYTSHYTKKPNTDDCVKSSDIALDIGLLFHYDFTTGISWNTELTYTPIIDEIDRGILVHETKISYLLKELGLVSDKLSDISLDLGMRNEYQTQPEPGANHTDTTWYMRLSKSW